MNSFLASKKDGTYCIGHASVLFRLDGKLFAFDPVWSHNPYSNFLFWPEQINGDEILPKLSGVITSHAHADHWAPHILSRLECPVYIMSGRPGLKAKLKKYAKVVNEIQPYTWSPLSDSVDVFFSEHPTNGVDSFSFVRGKRSSFAFGSDCFLDEKKLLLIKHRLPPIDVAFVPSQFVHWFPFLQKDVDPVWKRIEIERLILLHHKKAELFVKTLRPIMAFGTGADLYYKGWKDHVLNRHLFGSLPSCLSKCVAGDYVLDGKQYYREEWIDSFPRDVLPEPYTNTKQWIPRLKDIQRISKKLKAAKPFDGWEIQVNQVSIDLKSLNASVRECSDKYYRFDFDRDVYLSWLSGAITFEEALGSRRFEFRRSPNEYHPEIFEIFNNHM